MFQSPAQTNDKLQTMQNNLKRLKVKLEAATTAETASQAWGCSSLSLNMIRSSR